MNLNNGVWTPNTNLASVASVRANLKRILRDWLNNNGWMEVDCPILVKEPLQHDLSFTVDYFGYKSFISHNSQLYLEAQTLLYNTKSWTLNPSFRSEISETDRHLCEFSLLQLEELNVELNDIIQTHEKLIKYCINSILKDIPDIIKEINKEANDLFNIQHPFEIIEYDDAIDMLLSHDFQIDVNGNRKKIEWGKDLSGEAEYVLTYNKHNPVFITHFPINLRPFYIKRHDDGEHSISVDLLAPHGMGEISSGGVREDNTDSLKNELKKRGNNIQNFEWYLNLKKNVNFSHGGFGIGIDRFTKWMINSKSVKDVVAFPRTKNLIYP